MTSIITPEHHAACPHVESRTSEITSVVTPRQVSKRLSVFWAFLIISGGLLLCFVLMNGMCCAT
jgi:hypothetical protein